MVNHQYHNHCHCHHHQQQIVIKNHHHHNLQSGFTPMVNANEEERSRSKVRKSSNIGSVPKICHQIYDDYGADDFLHGYDY